MKTALSYTELLKKRGKKSGAHTRHQALGIELAEMLQDTSHTALYIKLAKEHDEVFLREIARSVVSRRGVKRRGAYFMRVFHEHLKDRQQKR